MLSEELLKKYKAKPNRNIFEHNLDLKKQKNILINLGYLNDKKKILLLNSAIDYHDVGKINFKFQKRIEENIKKMNGEKYDSKYLKFDKENEIEHNIISAFLINSEDFNSEDDYLSVLYSVIFHHRYSDAISTINFKIFQNLDKLLKSNLPKETITYEDCVPPDLSYQDLNTLENIKLLGLLMKCDHSASGGYEIEYPNDFLEVALNELLNEFKEKDKSADWNDMQKFCKENSDKNIIAIADTGMGKTEGGFLWGGNNKIFFVLPLRTAINAMYKRFNEVIIKGENKEERVGLLHSNSLEYYLNNKKELVIDDNDEKEMDILEYNKRGKHLSLPVTICTPDQIFNFILKYKGYESKLATLSYSKIILDEMQMYDANLLAAVIFGITKIIEMGGKIAIVTATFPPIIEYFLNKYLMKDNQNVIKDLDNPEETIEKPLFIKKKFTNNEKLRHNIVLIDNEIGIEEILWKFKENRKNKRSSNKILVICNTIKKAQEIYLKLKESPDLENKINMLHSNFIREDRESKEKEILDFGRTDFNGEGIWISTSLVEASLDIDFDYLFTELQDLNSLFQRFGRCNRKGKKSVDETNCFIYLKIEDKYLKEKDSRYGFIDKDIYENSKKGLKNYCKVVSKNELDNSEDYNELFKSFSKKITEGEKITLIEENLSFENLKDSPFVDEFEKAYDKYQRVLNSDKNSQDALKLRDIQSVTVIPYNIYEENEELIKELIKKIEDANLGLEERQKAKTELLKKTLSIQYYQLNEYFNILDSKSYSSKSINKFEKIIVTISEYDKELGFRATKNSKNFVFI